MDVQTRDFSEDLKRLEYNLNEENQALRTTIGFFKTELERLKQPPLVVCEVVKIINDTGFILNDKKTEIGIGKINITGITLTKDNIFLRRNFFKDFRDKSIFKKVITKKCEINSVKIKRVKNTNALAPNKRDEGKENFYVYFLKNRQEIKKGLLL